jgi:hypothetical protein
LVMVQVTLVEIARSPVNHRFDNKLGLYHNCGIAHILS